MAGVIKSSNTGQQKLPKILKSTGKRQSGPRLDSLACRLYNGLAFYVLNISIQPSAMKIVNLAFHTSHFILYIAY